mmetsp:Transcript_8073/g.16424  ORF Transcript_8073/g.16424 Transcript_8073/m.16424 type:complete len:327 (-) Transcript_8073:111-1091(-)
MAFGIPFVHAPAEAEAQCAFLAEARLVDAVASDDSDTLVFGAREVYRRLFSEDHMVECYTRQHLETRLGLVQADLIVLAMLLGCDYTLGVHGVGIVNGIEIVRAFLPGRLGAGRGDIGVDASVWMEELRQFRAWAQNIANWADVSAGVKDTDTKAVANFKRSHRNFRTMWSFPEDFPNQEVFQAFAQPIVDRSMEPFAWAEVDAKRVVAQLVECAHWTEEKALERLEPALRRYTDTLKQPRITDYMVPTGGPDVAKVRSVRMNSALRGLRGNEASDEDGQPHKGSASARPAARGRRAKRAGSAGGADGKEKAWGELRPGDGRIELE